MTSLFVQTSLVWVSALRRGMEHVQWSVSLSFIRNISFSLIYLLDKFSIVLLNNRVYVNEKWKTSGTWTRRRDMKWRGRDKQWKNFTEAFKFNVCTWTHTDSLSYHLYHCLLKENNCQDDSLLCTDVLFLVPWPCEDLGFNVHCSLSVH